jgi:hypothetical protein
MESKTTHQSIDTNGWVEVRDNPLSKVGVFDYLGATIQLPGVDPEERYAVFRSAEELSRPETIDSARLLPWIDDHPPTLLGKEEAGRVLPEEHGIGGVTGEDIYFKDGVLYGNIKFLTEGLAEQYRKGKKQLSMGYVCDYVPEAGEYEGMPYQFKQIGIRFNHLALVENGRMGKDVAVLDTNDKEIYMSEEDRVKLIEQAIAALTALAESYKAAPPPPEENAPQPKQEEQVKDEKKPENAPQPSGEKSPTPVPKEEQGKDKDEQEKAPPAEPSENLIAEAKGVIAAAKGVIAAAGGTEAEDEKEEEGEKDTKSGADEKSKGADEKGSGMDSVIAHLAARDKLATALKPHIGTFDHSEMTISEVAKYGNRKLGLKALPGQEFATLQGYLIAKRPKTPAATMDSEPEKTFIDQYLEGDKK